MDSNLCIWCLNPSADTDLEHVFPEALGCPEHITLPGTVVCRKCNNDLAHLDQIVAADFDFLTFMHRVPKKGGRPAAIDSRGNVLGKINGSNSEIFFNGESHPVQTHTGQTLAPFRGSPRDVRPSIRRDGPFSEMSFEVPLGQHKKFVRGITKIAVSALALVLGADVVRTSRFDWARRYVRFGGLKRRILLRQFPGNSYSLAVERPWKNDAGDYAVEIRIANIGFFVDLSGSEILYPLLREKMLETYGTKGWTTLPTEH